MSPTPAAPAAPACRVCGCTEDHACNPPCAWFDGTLCTTCALAAEALRGWSMAAVKPSLAALLRTSGIDPFVLGLFNEAQKNIEGKTPIELVHAIAVMLHERAAYISDNAGAIPVRVELAGRWQMKFLTELPPALALAEGFRLLLRSEEPQPGRAGEAEA